MRKKVTALILLMAMVLNTNGIARATEMEILETESETEHPMENVDVVGISSQEDLEKIAENLSGHYVLEDSITLEGNWLPLGNADIPFTGTFDGNGHVIRRMEIVEAESVRNNCGGLFGVIENASIRNLALEDVNISVSSSEDVYWGGIAGKAINSQISDCYVSGFISCERETNGTIGGVAGAVMQDTDAMSFESNLTRCISRVSVIGNGKGKFGAIAGSVEDAGKVSNCFTDNVSQGLFGVPYNGEENWVLTGNERLDEKKYLDFDFVSLWTMTDMGIKLSVQAEDDKKDGYVEKYSYPVEDGQTESEGTENTVVQDETESVPEIQNTEVVNAEAEASLEIVEDADEVNAGIAAYASSSDLVSGDFTYTVSGTNATITGYTGINSSVNIPSEIGKYKVIEIGESVFKNHKELEMINLSNGIEIIGYQAFYQTGLKRIKIPQSVKKIGTYSFQYCTNLKSMELEGNSNTEFEVIINDNAFTGCTKLSQVEFSNNVVKIGSSVFSGCSSIETIELPESIRTIGSYAFSGTGVKSITIPKSVTKAYGSDGWNYYVSPFAGAKQLEEIILEDGIQTIPDYMFNFTDNISCFKKIRIPESVTKIGYMSFKNCQSLQEIEIPKEVKSIGTYCFEDCTGMRKVKFTANFKNGFEMTINDNAFTGCTKLSQVEFSNNVVKIGSSVFSGCSSIETIELPESIRTIGSYAFSGTGIKSITIPKSVTKAYGSDGWNYYVSPFAGTQQLKEVVFEEGLETIPEHILDFNDSISPILKVKIPQSVTKVDYMAFNKCHDITIYGYKNSYAQQYANENNIPFVEYSLFTNEVISDSYGVTENQRTRAGDVYYEAKNFTKALNDYYSATTGRLKIDAQKANASPKNFKQLRQYDETASNRKTNQLLTIQAGTPDAAINDAYEVLYDFLKECMQTGIDKKLIDLDIDVSQSSVEIQAKVVNKIFDAIQKESGSYKGKGSNGFLIELNKTGIFGSAFGGVTITGTKGKYRGVTYTGAFCSSGKTVSAAMNQFIEDLSGEVKKLYKEAALSLWRDFMKKSQIDSVTEDMLKSFLGDKADYLNQKGYGKLLTSMLNMKKGYDLVNSISSTKTAGDALKKIQSGDMKALYMSITKLSYTDKELKNESVKAAMDKLESARKSFESSLYDYLYNQDTYDSLNFGEKFTHYWKSVFQCPVDVEIYDQNGKLIGSVVDGAVTYDASIYVELNGDVKTVYVPQDKKVRFKLLGTDDGTMNYVLEKYQDGLAVGRLNYYDVPLSEGLQYSQSINVKDIPENTSEIPLVQNGKKISANEYINAEDKEANITVEGNVDGKGIILGTGKYAKGDSVELVAIADEGYRFEGWYENDGLVNYESNYRFTAISSETVTAVFSKIPVELNYKIQLSEAYQDNASVVFYEKTENTADLVISLYDSEIESDMNIIIKKYDGQGGLLSNEKVLAEYDGGFHFTVSDVVLSQWKTLELSDVSGNQIVMIHNTALSESDSGNQKPDPGTSTPGTSTTTPDSNIGTQDSETQTSESNVQMPEQTNILLKGSNVKLSKTSVTYNGKAQKPAVVVKDNDGKKISSSNYIVKYKNNKKVGKASVTVTFKGNYKGLVKKTFKIVPKGTSISKLKSGKKGFSVKWKKQKTQTSGYEIQYSTNKKFKSAKKIGNIKTKTTSKNISKLKAKKKYYVRIRTYKKVEGKKYYSKWSKAKSVKTKK